LLRVFFGSHLFQGDRFRQPIEWRVPARELPALRRTVEDLAAELAGERPSLVYVRAALLKLQFDLLRHAGDAAGPELALVGRPEIARVLATIEEAVVAGRPVAVGALAAEAGVSPDHLNRLFHQEVGSSVRAYHQRRRVQQACAQLLDRRRALKEIADALGFGDVAHFHRSFRRVLGLTPGHYRSQFIRPR
jgi:transcriptional regulator GlxA family with amidase domain